MMKKNYQRKYLRAPFKEAVLYADGSYVFKAFALNISAGGLLIDELPSFPEKDEVPLMLAIPRFPSLKNFSLLKLQTFSSELFGRHIIRVKARMVRRKELAQNLENLFTSCFGLEFMTMTDHEQKMIDDFVTTFSSNLIYLQTLMDAFNSDEQIRVRVRILAKILGYGDIEKISQLRAQVTHDYNSLQWL